MSAAACRVTTTCRNDSGRIGTVFICLEDLRLPWCRRKDKREWLSHSRCVMSSELCCVLPLFVALRVGPEPGGQSCVGTTAHQEWHRRPRHHPSFRRHQHRRRQTGCPGVAKADCHGTGR